MLYFIPTPIGNLADISERSLSILGVCELIICEDTRISRALLTLLDKRYPSYQLLSIKKHFKSLHSHNEKEFFSKLDREIFDKNVAYLSDAGMPCISDPGTLLVRYAQENGVAYEVLSGANAALVGLVASGFCEKEFVFWGFLSIKAKRRESELKKALSCEFPVVLYESPKRILTLLGEIAKIAPEREIFAIKEISKKFEKKFKGSAKALFATLQGENLSGEWCVVLSGFDLENDDLKGFLKDKSGKDNEKIDISNKILNKNSETSEKKGVLKYLSSTKSDILDEKKFTKSIFKENSICLNEKDIMALSIGKKDKARLIARLRKCGTKAIYEQLLRGEL